ncbi:MAG: DUF4365 domain-containing protein [Planctomycetia bacterium]|nr:DUF4365 domain-containing protein [Planctomycetia bacterium]
MAAQPEDCDLGPLPRATREHELEQLGINALRAALPTDRFLFRDERVDDQGVDGSLEICMAGRYTNFRSQVQLKSTDSAATNSDGSISLQVKASNLNYLLSGTSPIYVLYVVPRNDLRYVWAFDELTRLDRDNPTWRDQETVTLRLARPLDGDAIEEMHERICREARSNRHIREILGRATIGEQVLIGVDVASLEVSDPDEVYQFLSTSGMTAVSAGYGKHILEHVHLLTLRRRQEPRMRLLCAYAQHTMGKYVAALGHLQEIMPLKGQLTEYDQQFFQSLCNACEFQIGRITRAEYDQRDAALTEAASGMFLLERQVHKLKREILSEQDPATVRSLLDAFQQMVGSLLSRDDVNQAFKIHAQIELLEAKGSRLVDEYMTAAAIKAMQADLGSLCDTAQSVERADAVRGLMIEWVETCNELIQAARALKPSCKWRFLNNGAFSRAPQTSLSQWPTRSWSRSKKPLRCSRSPVRSNASFARGFFAPISMSPSESLRKPVGLQMRFCQRRKP